jgi:putative tryptophan/tyrosine transport system substrate-binding protein
MSNKIFCLVLSALLLSLSLPAEAQQPKKVPTIGVVSARSSTQPGFTIEAFQRGLRELGYVEGHNIFIEYRYAEGKTDRFPGFAAELVRLKVDVIYSASTAAILAINQATKTIPVVIAIGGDPVRLGLVSSLARPGGNITGLTTLSSELGGKRLELLKEVAPKISRVAALFDRAGSGPDQIKEVEVAAQALGLHLQSLEVHVLADLDRAFSVVKKDGVSALIVLRNAVTNTHRKRIVELAGKSRLPTVYSESDFVEAGGLMSYGTDFPGLNRRAAAYVDKILKGAKPADLPVEQPTKFELVINLKAAKQIGLTIPQSVLYRADKVIR